jgi:hypothetical protein
MSNKKGPNGPFSDIFANTRPEEQIHTGIFSPGFSGTGVGLAGADGGR